MAADVPVNKIRFYSPQFTLQLRRRKLLKRFIIRMFKNEKKKFRKLVFIFCSDEYLLKINQRFLQHDTYTDIITFDLSTDKNIEGEIYISIERVKENAVDFNTSYSDEILRVMFHGVLHLCGLADKSRLQKIKMRAKEDYYLAKFKDHVSRETRST